MIKDNEYVCTRCENPCRVGGSFCGWEFVTVVQLWGYDSEDHTGDSMDTEAHGAHLCNSCYNDFKKDFMKGKMDISNYGYYPLSGDESMAWKDFRRNYIQHIKEGKWSGLSYLGEERRGCD